MPMSPQEQYAFIHDVVLESVTCGDTQINARDLKSVISRFKTRGQLQMSGKTQFEEQFEVCLVTSMQYDVHYVELLAMDQCNKNNFHFKVLDQVTPNHKEMNSKVAMKNKAKNRSMDFVPSETLPAHCMCWLCVCMQYIISYS